VRTVLVVRDDLYLDVVEGVSSRVAPDLHVHREQSPVLIAADVLEVQHVKPVVSPEVVTDPTIPVVGERAIVAHGGPPNPHVEYSIHLVRDTPSSRRQVISVTGTLGVAEKDFARNQ